MRPAALSSELADKIAAGDHVPLIKLASFYSARLWHYWIMLSAQRYWKILYVNSSKASDRLCSKILLPGVALYAMK
jgi:hypothetical protein